MIVRVPASSANLGPGFDSFGIAWQLYNEISFQLSDETEILGCAEGYQNEENLALRAYRRVLERCGVREEGGVSIRFGKTSIPVSRGLGSSAALITAGVMAANELYGLGLSRDELFLLATEVEGHPDNVAPALYGGLSVSAMAGGRAVTRRFPVSDKLFFTALIPPFELSTALARSVLPESVSRADAVFNVSRGALVLRALGDGDAELLAFAMDFRRAYRGAGVRRGRALHLRRGADAAVRVGQAGLPGADGDVAFADAARLGDEGADARSRRRQDRRIVKPETIKSA